MNKKTDIWPQPFPPLPSIFSSAHPFPMYLPEFFSSYPAPLIIHGSRPRSNRAINDYCAQVAQKTSPREGRHCCAVSFVRRHHDGKSGCCSLCLRYEIRQKVGPLKGCKSRHLPAINLAVKFNVMTVSRICGELSRATFVGISSSEAEGDYDNAQHQAATASFPFLLLHPRS